MSTIAVYHSFDLSIRELFNHQKLPISVHCTSMGKVKWIVGNMNFVISKRNHDHVIGEMSLSLSNSLSYA